MHDVNTYLSVNGVRLTLNHRCILSAINLQCHRHQVTGLLGRNGAGKSCLFQVIYGILPAEKSIEFNGQVLYAAYRRPDLITSLPQFHFIPKRATIRSVLKNFGLTPDELLHYFPGFRGSDTGAMGNLSTGERRLIEIFTIVRSAAAFSLLDEPFSNLSPLHTETVMQLIKNETSRKGFLITDHRFQQVLDIAQKAYVLKNGGTHLVEHNEDLALLGYTSYRNPG